MGRRELARSLFGALLSMGLLCAVTGGGAEVRPSAMGSGRAIRLVGKETPVRKDFVRFTNGDLLSGKVQEIVEGSVTIKPEVAESPGSWRSGGLGEWGRCERKNRKDGGGKGAPYHAVTARG